MKSSNLAQRLEEFDAVIESLRLTGERTIRMDAQDGANAEGAELPARPRRVIRTHGIVVRDQGLRSFKVF